MIHFQLIREWITESSLPALVVHAQHDPVSSIIIAEVMPTHWYNGYVGIPADHRLHGIDFHKECEFLELDLNQPIGARGLIPLIGGIRKSPDVVFDVHGSITFSGPGKYLGFVDSVDSDIWWFGFDCHHVDDDPDVHDETYVSQECERLASQLFDAR